MRESILIILFALLGVLSARAYDFEVNGIYYNRKSGTTDQVEVTSGSPKYSGSVVISAMVEYEGITYTVTAIGAGAFNECGDLTSVTIPESVTSIGYCAFNYCRGLTSVTIPKGVTTIESGAFQFCSGLTSVTIPESVGTIKLYAFGHCTGLLSIEWNAINCQDFTSSDAPFPSTLTSITFGSQVEHIPSFLCYGMNKLTSVTIGESVTSIGYSTFYGCTSIRNPLYNNKVFAYMPTSFSGSYEIPSGIQSIASRAFEDCSGLTSVTIPESVTAIGESAFEDCSGLISVTIPAGVTSIEFGTFWGCSGLTSVTIPNSVTSIGESAFEACSSLTAVTIGESVDTIGDYAFSSCTGLSSVEWNAIDCRISIHNGPNRPFYGCKNITDITFGNQVTRIPAKLCSGLSGLTSVTIPESVTFIGAGAFAYCNDLTSVTSLAVSPPSCGENTFVNSYGDNYAMPLYVPHGSRSAYRSAKEWCKFNVVEDGTRTVTVNVNYASMGRVTGGGDYDIDEEITLEAIPNKGYYFDRWDDGNTYNPRTLTVRADITLMAVFAKDQDNPDDPDNPTPNENLESDHFRVYAQNRTILLSEDRGLVQVYNMAGQCVYNGHATAIPVPQSGVYIVAVGQQRFKVLVR